MEVQKITPNSKSQMMYDPMIISRVKQYLEENVHQTYVDVGVMAKLLQERYREYSRRKVAPFRQLVEQAYKTVLRSYGLDSNPSSDDNDDISSDLEVMEDRPDLMNNLMTNMYMDKQGSGSGAPANSNELIDISSDESDSESIGKKTNDSEKPIPNVPSHLTIQKVSVIKDAKKSGYPANAKPTSSFDKSSSQHGQVIASFSRDHKRRKVDDDDETSQPKTNSEGTTSSTSSSNLIKPAKIGAATAKSLAKNAATPQTQTSIIATPKPNNKKLKREFSIQTSSLKFKDVGGLHDVLNELWDLFVHIKNPQVYKHIGLPPPRGFLLHGPPGCGKTLLAQAIAGQLEIELFQVAATELVGGVSGESEQRIRELFEQAAAAAPCVLFIDEIDAISSNRQNAQKDMERRIVSQLLISLDGLSKLPNGDQVLIIGATSRPDSLDPALRRVGRFDQEISLGIPDRTARKDILEVVCANLTLSRPFNFDAIAALTPGYVGADLLALATRAASLAVKRALRAKEEQAVSIVISPENTPVKRTKTNETEAPMEIATIDLDDADDVSKPLNATETIPTTNESVSAMNGTVEAPAVELTEPSSVETILEGLEKSIENTEEPAEKSEKKAESPVEPMTIEDNDTTKTEDAVPKVNDEDIPIKDSNVTSATANKTPEASVVVDETPKVTGDEKAIDINAQEPEEILIKIIDESLIDAKSNHDTQQTVSTNLSDSDIEMTSVAPVDVVDLSREENCATPVNAPTTIKEIPVELARWLRENEQLLVDEDLKDICITMADFTEATKLVQPSAKREGFITVPDVTWDDIGSLHDIRSELQLAVLAPVKYPEAMQSLGLQTPSGVLLCGPPGCGKTLLAKAVANEAGVNFISVKGPELLNMYVGESERAVRQCFQRARNSAPCVIFFDEFDALCPARSGSSENTSSSRVVNQLLTEMDGMEDRKGVFLLAATNRPDIIDPAVLRPGRLDKILYVGLPDFKDRSEILQARTKKKPLLDDDVDFEEIAGLTESYTGADLAGLVRQAALQALRQYIASPDAIANAAALRVNRNHFLTAIKHTRPSVSDDDIRHYTILQKKLKLNVSPTQ